MWQPQKYPWSELTTTEVLRTLQSDGSQGLDGDEAQRRLLLCGDNTIELALHRPLWRLVLGQFTDFMIVVLLLAALISGMVGSAHDAAAIVVIVLFNALIGVVQEYRAERALEALRKLHAPHARVVRGGERQMLPATLLVPGDIVFIEAGDVIPADLRLLEAHELALNEAALSGESQPVAKVCEAEEHGENDLTIHSNIAYLGTQLSAGRGCGVVVATGMGSELGRIATLIEGATLLHTPLQQRLAQFGRRLAWTVLAICLLIFLIGMLRGEELVLMFLTAVSLAVAAIPEALPAVVIISLAFGARRMVRHHALMRRLPAVETLGSVSIICSDKTGTLTENRMVLDRLLLSGQQLERLPRPEACDERLLLVGQLLSLNNDVELHGNQLHGDPTEVALRDAARSAGFIRSALEQQMVRLAELPFDAERKRMSTLHQSDSGALLLCKGAPEVVIGLCREEWGPSGVVPLQPLWQQQASTLAEQGYRVLALAMRRFAEAPTQLDAAVHETGLVLLGLVGLVDPPRAEAKGAVAQCRSAGITPVMITGDHPGTALAVAQRLQIAEHAAEVITGSELARLDEQELQQRSATLRVYARVTPEQKLRIVRALQAQGQFVAMTGDGVNDAPALRQADIGVAMGRKGTAVAREAADMVLLDDNFATIVAAVREGRRIYDNVRKFVKYTMTSNSGEIWTLLLAPFLGMPIPLLPLQILWINLVTDGLPGLALTVERAERNAMQRPPRPPQETIFAHGMWQHILWVGLLIGGVSLLAQAWAWHQGSDHWQTMVFTVLVFAQLLHSLAIRSERESLFTLGITTNRPLLLAVVLTMLLQLAVIYLPLFNPIFKTTALTAEELLVCLMLPLLVLAAVEVEKYCYRRGWIYQNRGAQ